MNSYSPHIDHLIENGYEFRLGDYLNRGWELFTKDLGSYIAFALVSLVAGSVIGLIPFLGIVASYLLVQPLVFSGYFLYTRKVANDEERSFQDFFAGFDHVLQLFLFSLVSYLLIFLGLGLLLIPGVYLAVSYMLGIPLILSERMEFWAAMETSRKIIGKNWGNFLLLVIVSVLIYLAGFLALIVGIIAAAPLVACIFYAVYEDIVGFQQDPLMDKIEEIGLEDEEDLFEGLN